MVLEVIQVDPRFINLRHRVIGNSRCIELVLDGRLLGEQLDACLGNLKLVLDSFDLPCLQLLEDLLALRNDQEAHAAG